MINHSLSAPFLLTNFTQHGIPSVPSRHAVRRWIYSFPNRRMETCFIVTHDQGTANENWDNSENGTYQNIWEQPERNFFHCLWEYCLVKHLWEAIYRSLQKIRIGWEWYLKCLSFVRLTWVDPSLVFHLVSWASPEMISWVKSQQ